MSKRRDDVAISDSVSYKFRAKYCFSCCSKSYIQLLSLTGCINAIDSELINEIPQSWLDLGPGWPYARHNSGALNNQCRLYFSDNIQ